MKNYEPMMSFDEEAAEAYDEMDHRGDTMETVAFLEQLAGGGTALELAIGTGRVALPLATRGIRVDGIDLSPAMVAKLRAKPGGDQLAVTIGDFAEVPVQGAYRLIYLVYKRKAPMTLRPEDLSPERQPTVLIVDDEPQIIDFLCLGLPTMVLR